VQCSSAGTMLGVIQVGDDNYEVVPGSQFVVSRTALKDNSSYYKVMCHLMILHSVMHSK